MTDSLTVRLWPLTTVTTHDSQVCTGHGVINSNLYFAKLKMMDRIRITGLEKFGKVQNDVTATNGRGDTQ